MFGIDNLKISFSFSPFLFFLFVFLLIGFTVFIYRYTVPQISSTKKILLIITRTLALTLLVLAIFEPTLTIIKKSILKPTTWFFVDNSKSILYDDGSEKNQKILGVLNELKQTEFAENTQLKTFGTKISEINIDNLDDVTFKEGSTNFANIFSSLSESNENISSIVILSDGVITDGSNPINSAEKSGIPIFTLGIGDTTKRKDIEIKNVIYNEFIYAENPTTLSATILNDGFANRTVNLTFYENDVLIQQKNIVLNQDGIQNISFDFTPKSSGEKKLTLVLSALEGEYNRTNNKKVFYINVLSNKVKILLLAGSPSPDLSFIKNTLLADDNLSVNSITQIGVNKFLENNNRDKLLDSAEVLLLIGFPSKETSSELLNKVARFISEKNISFLFILSGSIDFNKLVQLQKALPFASLGVGNSYLEIQPNVTPDQSKNPLLQNNSADPIAAWNNLPPVYQLFSEFNPKPESEIAARTKVNNVPTNKPLILTRRLGNQRSIAVLAKDIWKWKLQTAMKDQDVFDRFILNSIKWLNSPEDKKRVQIRTLKKLFALGEEVEFTAQVYDDTFNPISDAEVKVRLKNDNDKFELNLNSLGNGLYEGVLQTNKAGNYSFVGEAKLNNKLLGSDKGLFNVGEVDIEMMDTKMDYEFLNSLANVSGGKFFNVDQSKSLFKLLSELNLKSSKEKIDTKEYSLWSNEFLMIAIILLFGIEWFIRKREGML
ncbi:MAG: hypothetical protein A2455_17580 [Ignavibacteria bacterium RIFOXYC2_FULL_35_16]|nr:MAG: hypothetical protein A2058_06600 [Ignavibacteria bacterium GWA2_36_19]OGU56206.1 MAG: hypothetical protein A2X60_06845 [Ignavibacteria bacterium GWF2_35_20]OGU83402.1 MAG: hypothetical protein A2254_14015 [Ignavibacteria bacterium RIFOXYA2_FULL_35_9]OGU86718.1 MAG: hypothetical protein A2492_02895 [Ignavibacteria bacterium RIFOXYC12_FULL_35_11]OGU89413.1 MAG: hypothetical protein A3K31_14635 [Ignavibacteria bacterium RIFOXYA12_FULL_35_25]OGU94105.1 MAG: hypothetical protein A2347_13125